MIKLRSIFILLIISLLPGCFSNQEQVRIGFIGCLSSEFYTLGLSAKNGAQYALEKANNRKQNNFHYELVPRDCYTGEQALATLHEFRLLDVNVIIGPLMSTNVETYLPMANDNHLLLISPTATSNQFTGLNDALLRNVADHNTYAAITAEYILKQGESQRVVILQDEENISYTEDWKNTFINAYDKSKANVKVIAYNSLYNPDNDTIIANALRLSPDVIIMISNEPDTIQFAQYLKRNNIHLTLIATESTASDNFIISGGSAVENIIHTQFYDRKSTSEHFLQFNADYKKRFRSTPNFPAYSAYDAVNIAITAIEKAPKNTIKESILAIKAFDGVLGEIIIDEFGDTRGTVFLTQIKNGKFVPLEH